LINKKTVFLRRPNGVFTVFEETFTGFAISGVFNPGTWLMPIGYKICSVITMNYFFADKEMY